MEILVPKALDKQNLLRGTLNMSRAEISKYAPHYTGQTQIFMLKGIRYLEDMTGENTAIAKMHAANFKNLIEFCSLSYSGTPDLSSDDTTVETGYSETELNVPISNKYDGTQFTIKILEQRGEPLRKAIEYIRNGLFDAYGKWSHMHGSQMELSPENYTCEIAIVQLDPKLQKIQDISLWQAVLPMPVDRSNLDWNQGTVEIVQPKDLQLKGRYIADAYQLQSVLEPLLAQRIALVKKAQSLIL